MATSSKSGRIKLVAIGGGSFGAGSLVGEVIDATLDRQKASQDATSCDSGRYEEAAPGHVGTTFRLSYFDVPTDAGQAAITANVDGDTTVAIWYRPEGTGSGLPEHALTGFVTGEPKTSNLRDQMKVDVTFQITGDSSPSTQP